MRILSVFEHFAKERSLATHEHYHRFVVFFLEVHCPTVSATVITVPQIFNNVIQYQYEGNASLIYQILQRKKCFESLATLQGLSPPPFFRDRCLSSPDRGERRVGVGWCGAYTEAAFN